MIIGYDRPQATVDGVASQEKALRTYGCELVFIDTSGENSKQRPGLLQAKNRLRSGDTFVIWSFERFGISLFDILEWISFFEEKGIRFVSIQEAIDTSSAMGEMVFKVCGILHQFEKGLILKRTYPGLEAAKAMGRLGGRPQVIPEARKREIVKLYRLKKMPVWKLCKTMGISKTALYKFLKVY